MRKLDRIDWMILDILQKQGRMQLVSWHDGQFVDHALLRAGKRLEVMALLWYQPV